MNFKKKMFANEFVFGLFDKFNSTKLLRLS